MKWMITADSSCDLRTLVTGSGEIGYETVPFVLTLDDVDYKDTPELDIPSFVAHMEKSRSSHSSCPSPGDWAEVFEKADNTIAFTISANLSGSHNSAVSASHMVMEEHPDKKISVVDSLSTGPKLVVMVSKALEMIQKGEPLEKVTEACEQIAHSMRTIFTLCSFHNLAQNGRIGKLASFVVQHLGIRVIGAGSKEGRIQMKDKARGDGKTLKRVLELMEEEGYTGTSVFVSHCLNEGLAIQFKNMIQQKWAQAKVEIFATRGLDSYYAENRGLIVAY